MFIDALEQGNNTYFYTYDWRLLISVLSAGAPSDLHREAFATQWVTHGAKVRQQVRDDSLLIQTLRRWLPKYDGGGLVLYRGESAERAEKQRYGLCWTPKIEVATMFASGLNSMPVGGGVLLQTYASRDAIVSGPSYHSKYLGEFEHTVDPTLLSDVQILSRFPSIDSNR